MGFKLYYLYIIRLDMSQLLLQWLNDEIQLSKKVSDLELEFANGYLFGELLNKYN